MFNLLLHILYNYKKEKNVLYLLLHRIDICFFHYYLPISSLSRKCKIFDLLQHYWNNMIVLQHSGHCMQYY